MKLKKRTIIRIISFGIILMILVAAKNFKLMKENSRQKIMIRNHYLKSLEDLCTAAENINNTIEKQLCAGTSEQQEALANKLFNEASTAKNALSQLPVQELDLENTYKFLSQVGNYAQYVAKNTESNPEKYDDLKLLKKYSEDLNKRIKTIEMAVASDEINIYDISENSTEKVPYITEDFTEYEESFSSYPRLIYDGPFSDHLLEKEPEMLKRKDSVSRKKAMEKACLLLEIPSYELTEIYEQNGKMPSWVFSDGKGSLTCAVTQSGGYVSYFVKSRRPSSESISIEEGVDKGTAFLKENGYSNMKVTYFEKTQNTLVINFAYNIDDVTCYTDLIKVTVAMDNGEILGMECTGYLTNHQTRQFPKKVISIKECQKKISPLLKCVSGSKVLIPTEGGREAYCYEFKCKSEDGKNVLVYFNARTGKEEQILILFEDENGTLTM